jgi:two-component system sensor histidine kinase/response regulator
MIVNQQTTSGATELDSYAGSGSDGEELFSAPGTANILLVDDRQDKRLALETVIADLGQNIVQASSGKEALRCLLQQQFAVILLDVNMPGMDGFETAHLIRKRRSSEHTPIIFVTGISDTETHVSRGYSLGAVDYILTPVLPEVLRTKVSVFVELFKNTEQIRRQAERLRQARDELELRVRERTKELAVVNETLKAEIIERARAEEEVRALNISLEQRVHARTAELAAANEELEAFTYSVAHDLQAPLRNIQSYTQMLDGEFAAKVPDEARHCLKRIGLLGKSMGQLLEDMLRLSIISKQNLQCRVTELRDLVEEVVAGFKLETKDRQMEWCVGELSHATCDPGLIRQVFFNLISNAVKYSKPRDKAVIQIGQIKIGDETAIYVQDNGVGFDMKYSDKLFGVFQRLHGAEDFEGTGVGLATVARIIRKHGGRIWAEAEVDKGAAFYFILEGASQVPPIV